MGQAMNNRVAILFFFPNIAELDVVFAVEARPLRRLLAAHGC
jgi:hypothetical protein